MANGHSSHFSFFLYVLFSLSNKEESLSLASLSHTRSNQGIHFYYDYFFFSLFTWPIPSIIILIYLKFISCEIYFLYYQFIFLKNNINFLI